LVQTSRFVRREKSSNEASAMPIDVPILFVGNAAHPEFAPIASWLALRNAQFADDVSTAIARIDAGFTPTIIVVTQPWPGHASATQIESLRQAAPLARIASLLGTWIEGEARSGKPWPAIWRTYWHAWLPRFTAEIDRIATGEETIWPLPSTAGDEERLLHVVSQDKATKPTASPTKRIAVISTNRETAEVLSDICRDRSWQSLWLKSLPSELADNIDLAIFDSRNLHESEISQISNFKSRISNIPLIVLAGFPRIADVEALKSRGVAAVVSKPFLNRELAWQVNQFLSKSSQAA
jgi:CheY-like chemotaxis protein